MSLSTDDRLHEMLSPFADRISLCLFRRRAMLLLEFVAADMIDMLSIRRYAHFLLMPPFMRAAACFSRCGCCCRRRCRC